MEMRDASSRDGIFRFLEVLCIGTAIFAGFMVNVQLLAGGTDMPPEGAAYLTQITNSFGNTTTWLTYSGTFNENTGTTSFPVDLSGHAVAGNAVLQITSEVLTSQLHGVAPILKVIE
jgi:hypothetical protein